MSLEDGLNEIVKRELSAEENSAIMKLTQKVHELGMDNPTAATQIDRLIRLVQTGDLKAEEALKQAEGIEGATPSTTN